MTGPTDSSFSDRLEWQSLQLDIKILQQNRESDRHDFEVFQEHMTTSFGSLQNTLGELKSTLSNFIAGFPKPRENPPNPQEVAQGSGAHNTPQGPAVNLQDAYHTPVTAGSATLVDKQTCKELNLDGSNKVPYRHPHFAANKNIPPEARPPTASPPATNGQQLILNDQGQHDQAHQMEGRGGMGTRDPVPDNRRPLALVKPAKYNIPEFDGFGTVSWIQTIELYFEAARTPLERKTEIAVTYLKGPAIEWWRGTGITANTLPWYRFCRLLGDRFAEISVCDNVRLFHALTQT